jgi:hypothetical protein
MATAFIITIDTEGDNIWARPRQVTTRNAAWLPAFQDLAQCHGFRPTWLVNWEMAHAPACVEFLRDVLARDAGEVGLHLHAWDTPPLEPLTNDDGQNHPYLCEYSESLMFAKLDRLAGVLEDTFQRPLRSHRAGRWALDSHTVRWLRQRGFAADCSVCPGIDWRSTQGSPHGAGGPDYRRAPHEPYFLDEQDVTRPATHPEPDALLEVPLTIRAPRWPWARTIFESYSKRHSWLRPNGRNGAALRKCVDDGLAAGRAHLLFMLHSSELMPGGSPSFPTADSVTRLYEDLAALFAQAQGRGCRARTLGEFAAEWRTAKVAQTV